MREKMKKKKNMIIGGLLAVVFLMSVGYAAFASNLSISGTANTSSWIIKITNIREKTKTAGVTNKGTSYTDLTANFQAELTNPGDSITYEVTVENQGNIDAAVKEITKTVSNSRYIEVTYSGLVQGQMLYKQGQENSTATMDVTITFKDLDYEGTYTNWDTANISIALDFEQEGNNVDTTKKYLITYDTGDGTPVESRYVEWDEYNIGSYETPTRLGYTFTRWYTGAKGAGTSIMSYTRISDIISDENQDSIILYATYNVKQYTVVFDSAGGSAVADTKNYWTDSNLINSSPTLAGYTFLGWYTKPNGEGTKITGAMRVSDIIKSIYGPGTDVASGENGDEVTLYATWTEKKYTLSFNSLGGSEVSSQTLKWTDTITYLPTPTKEGYTFEGWYTSYNTKTKKVAGNLVSTGNSYGQTFSDSGTGKTLYAKWTANS